MASTPLDSDTTVVKVAEAKAHLSDLLARAQSGERIVIARGNDPVVELRALAPKRSIMGLGKALFPELDAEDVCRQAEETWTEADLDDFDPAVDVEA
ncbi:MAG: type II toxin-antitoxin system prevent-host-death family antitoxin [Pseudomonadota bacterium]